MDIQLSEEAQRFVITQVQAGLYPTPDAVVEDALSLLRQHGDQVSASGRPESDPVIGIFHDDAELLDEIVEKAMRDRREHPWRLPPGE